MTNRPGPLRSALAALVAVVAAVGLGACGGGEPEAPRTTTVTVTPTRSASTTPPSTSATTPSTTTSTAPLDQPPRTFDQALQHMARGTLDTGASPVFTSPTGNLYCAIAAAGGVPAGCELRDGRVKAPGVCDTGGGGAPDVGRIEWSDGAPKPVCNSDTMVTPGQQVLQYGSLAKATGSPVQCLSEEIGMTCVDTVSQKGFFLAKGVYVVF